MTLTALIILFGALILLAGSIIVINPDLIFGLLNRHANSLGLHVLAVVVRVIIGVLLIVEAEVSRFPLVIEIIGWLSIAAAAVFALIGRRNFLRLMNWALSLTKPYGRIGGMIAIGFGVFLIYAFV